MHRCARDDNAQACHILLTYNVDTSIVSIQGFTAMQLASDNIKSILQGDLIPVLYYGPVYLVLIWSSFVAPPAVIDLETQLLEASKSGDCDQVKRLLTTYPHIVNCRDLDGR